MQPILQLSGHCI